MASGEGWVDEPLITASRVDEETGLCKQTVADPFSMNLTTPAGAILYLMGSLWTLIGIVVFTERSVLPALDKYTKDIHPVFANGTIYAGMTSLPGLFANLLGLAVGDTSSVGIGACVGSALMNQQLAVSAGIFAALKFHGTDSVKVDAREVVRDVIATGVSMAALLSVLVDGQVFVSETLFLTLLYLLYILTCWLQAVGSVAASFGRMLDIVLLAPWLTDG